MNTMLHVNVPRLRLLVAALAAALVVLVVVILLWPDDKPVPPPPEPRLTRELRAGCRLLLKQPLTNASPRTRQGMSWVCGRLGVILPWPSEYGCDRSVTFAPAESLEENLLRYAVLFGFSRMLRADALVDPLALATLRPVFPGLMLPPRPPQSSSEVWETVSFWEALGAVHCRPGEEPGKSEQPQRYQVDGRPDGRALQLFHPFEKELRQELRFSTALQRRAEGILLKARGQRPSATFVGLLLPSPDHIRPPVSHDYLRHSLEQYRRRFSDALFVVVAANTTALPPSLSGEDVVRVDAAVERDPALSLAVRAACHHSILTGDEGFWGAYLAGGNMIAPPPEKSDAEGFGWLFMYSQTAMDDRWSTVS